MGSILPRPIKKGLETIGATGDIVCSFAEGSKDLLGKGTKYFKVKANASIEEEELIQTTSFLLLKAKSIKKLMKTLNISAADAAELLEQEMAKKKK